MPIAANLIVTEIEQLSSEQYPYWQVRWIGELSINHLTEELTVKVHLVPVSRVDRLEPNGQSKDLIYRNSFDFSNERIISVGVGYLPLLTIGSVFRNGKFYCNPNYITRTFRIDVNEQTQKIISVRGNWEHSISGSKFNKWYLPDAQFKGSNLTGNCVFVELSEELNNQAILQNSPFQLIPWLRQVWSDTDTEKYLNQIKTQRSPIDLKEYGVKPYYSAVIIPCMEMFAFYYAISSKMFQHLLADGLVSQTNRIFNEKKTIKPSIGVRGHIRLTKHIPFVDAPVVAPLAFDDYANQQAKNIYISRLKNREKGSDVADVKFPFINKQTTLKVHGVPILSGPKVFFLVYRIDSCTQIPLCEDFGVWRDNMRRRGKNKPKDDEENSELDQNNADSESSETENNIKTEEIIIGIRDRKTNRIISSVSPSKFRQVVSIPHPRKRFGDKEGKIWDIEPDEETVEQIKKKIKFEYIFSDQIFEQFSTSRAKGKVKTTKGIIEGEQEKDGDRERFDYDAPLSGGSQLFADILEYTNSKTDVQAKQILIFNNINANYEYQAVSNIFPQKLNGIFFPWTNRTFYGESHTALIAELSFRDKHFAYLFEIVPVRESNNIEKRQYKMLLIYDVKNFIKLSNLDLFNVLATCAKNEGKWLNENELESFGRKTFKHASKEVERYVERLIEPLAKVGWKSLGD